MTPIPPDRLATHRGLVHVQGWPAGCCFKYLRTDPDGTHHLETPKTRKRYTTKNAILYTRRYEPKP